MQYRRIKRAIDGVLLLDKPLGYSSNQALQQIKHMFQAAKAGHTGSLDPLATGLLPICLGEATKFSHFLLDADKSYRALVQLGSTTTTADAEGDVLESFEVRVTDERLRTVLQSFVGEIEQIPPMYSALKHQGKALYEYARDGVDIERPARKVMIYKIELISYDRETHRVEFDVTCSKGTYVRTLAEDIGRKLGCGAYLAGLRRTSTGHFQLEGAYTLAQLESMTQEERDALLLGPDAMVTNLPQVVLDDDSVYYLLRGQAVWKAGVRLNGVFRIYSENGKFLGLGELDREGRVAPRRLLRQTSSSV
jgi:tRNA pseudouridine55 synthase